MKCINNKGRLYSSSWYEVHQYRGKVIIHPLVIKCFRIKEVDINMAMKWIDIKGSDIDIAMKCIEVH